MKTQSFVSTASTLGVCTGSVLNYFAVSYAVRVWWKGKERKVKEEYLYCAILRTMYISKCAGMDHSFTCKYTMPAFPL